MAVDWSDKEDIFAKSYAEVLAAIKHQDDKAGRVITALAFLTGAAFGLFSKFGTAGFAVKLPGSAVSVPAFCFVTFAAAAGLSLIFAAAAIGPTRGFPRLGGTEQASDLSLLYFSSIAASEAAWNAVAEKEPADLKKDLAEDYHRETAGLARRVQYKMAWSREAGACLQLAVTSLIVLGVFLSSAFSVGTRWWISSGFILTVSLLPLAEYLYMWLFRYPEAPRFLWSYVVFIAIIALAAILLLTATIHNTYWLALPYALFGAVLMPRIALIDRRLTGIVLGLTTAVGFVLGGILIAKIA